MRYLNYRNALLIFASIIILQSCGPYNSPDYDDLSSQEQRNTKKVCKKLRKCGFKEEYLSHDGLYKLFSCIVSDTFKNDIYPLRIQEKDYIYVQYYINNGNVEYSFQIPLYLRRPSEDKSLFYCYNLREPSSH